MFCCSQVARITPVVAVFGMVVVLALMGTNVVLPYLSDHSNMLKRVTTFVHRGLLIRSSCLGCCRRP